MVISIIVSFIKINAGNIIATHWRISSSEIYVSSVKSRKNEK